MHKDQDTIVAIATPSGVGGISVLRVSGKKAAEISTKICTFLPSTLESHRIYYGTAKRSVPNLQGKDGQYTTLNQDLDEVLVSYFAEGKSFTGEETIEISCHGNPLICGLLLDELVKCGARIADRGEFTYRAFMNGRIDLVQAESVLSLIESKTEESTRQSLRQLKGNLSTEMKTVESDIVWCMANIEASIDFSTEGLEIVKTEDLIRRISKSASTLKKLSGSYKNGRALSQGIKVVLFGEPNAGKSSLLNLLVGDDRAIVAEEAGTTRDIIEATVNHRGYLIQLIDTAGIRTTSQKVEAIGIERAIHHSKNADLVLFVLDSSKDFSADEIQAMSHLQPSKTIVLFNKTDISAGGAIQAKEQLLKQKMFEGERVSAKRSEDAAKVLNAIIGRVVDENIEDGSVVLKARHFELLNFAHERLNSTLAMVKDQISSELIAIDLKEALIAVQEVLGIRFDDQIMDRVFKEFCIGK